MICEEWWKEYFKSIEYMPDFKTARAAFNAGHLAGINEAAEVAENLPYANGVYVAAAIRRLGGER